MKKIKFEKKLVSFAAIGIMALCICFFYACEKNRVLTPTSGSEALKESSQDNSVTKTTDDQNLNTGEGRYKDKEKYCMCPGYVLKQDKNGQYSCPTGTGCSKTQLCPCPLAATGTGPGGIGFVEIAFLEFKAAFNEGRIKGFFTSQKWRPVFPDLILKPEIVEKLQNGNVVITKRENVNTGKVFFIGVEASKANNFNTDMDVLFALEVPAALQ